VVASAERQLTSDSALKTLQSNYCTCKVQNTEPSIFLTRSD